VLLVTAGIRATPGVLMLPLESEYGWSDAAISVITAARSGSRAPYASSPGFPSSLRASCSISVQHRCPP
jgi:hypothetical protein